MEMTKNGMMNDLLRVIAMLLEEDEMKATLKGSLQGGFITGLTTVVGGLLLGPIGLAIGGVLGGVGFAVTSKSKFNSVASVIKSLSQEEKEKLKHAIITALEKNKYVIGASLYGLVVKNPDVKEIVANVFSKFVQEDLNTFKHLNLNMLNDRIQ